MLFATLFAPFGSAQPGLWLLVARSGALVALALAFRVAYRLTAGLLPGRAMNAAGLMGPAPALLAGLVAAASLANWSGFVVQNALGYSEGLAVALMLIAIDRLLDGSPHQALLAGFAAGLERPEAWLLWVPLAVCLTWREPRTRRLVRVLLALTPLLWVLPELWGSGQLLRAVTRAHHPPPGTVAFSRCPLCTVLAREAWPSLPARVEIPALAGLLLAAGTLWRRRRSWRGGLAPSDTRGSACLLALGGAGLLWWLGIAVETQAGFAGDTRYLEPGTALLAIAGGVAWGFIANALASVASRVLPRLRWAPAAGTLVAGAALVSVPPWIGQEVIDPARTGRALDYQAGLRSSLSDVVQRTGGAAALLRCGPVMADPYQVPMVAWALGVPMARIESAPAGGARTDWPAVILQDRATPASALVPAPAQIRAWEHDGAHYTLLARVRAFRVFSTCPHKVMG